MEEHIKSVVGDYIKKSKKRKELYRRIQEIIKKNLSKNIACHIRPELTPEGELVLVLDSSSAAYEVSLRKDRIDNAVKKEIKAVKKIKTEVR